MPKSDIITALPQENGVKNERKNDNQQRSQNEGKRAFQTHNVLFHERVLLRLGKSIGPKFLFPMSYLT